MLFIFLFEMISNEIQIQDLEVREITDVLKIIKEEEPEIKVEKDGSDDILIYFGLDHLQIRKKKVYEAIA